MTHRGFYQFRGIIFILRMKRVCFSSSLSVPGGMMAMPIDLFAALSSTLDQFDGGFALADPAWQNHSCQPRGPGDDERGMAHPVAGGFRARQ